LRAKYFDPKVAASMLTVSLDFRKCVLLRFVCSVWCLELCRVILSLSSVAELRLCFMSEELDTVFALFCLV
jgi:hypothetical protein